MRTAGGRFGALVSLTATLAACHNDPRPADTTRNASMPVNGFPPPSSGADSVAQVALGARLFEDVRLSRDSTISCGTCHMPSRAFAEPRAVSHGIGERARKRNTPSLLNVGVARPKAGVPHSSFDWDGRAGSLEDQLSGVFSLDGDMGIELSQAIARLRADSTYDAEFRRVFGRRADADALVAALVAFQKSLVVTGSSFDRFYLGGDSTALTESEIRGWHLFRSNRAGCAGCHVPLPDPGGSGVIVFSDWRFHNLGVGYENGRMEDVGRYGVTREPDAWGAFLTPSLNNVGLTAPYMHDGSLATLEEVIEFYAQGGVPNPEPANAGETPAMRI